MEAVECSNENITHGLHSINVWLEGKKLVLNLKTFQLNSKKGPTNLSFQIEQN